MCKKVLGMFLTGTLFFFCSCIDDTYDLNKGIETDVKIEGNRLALPLGSLKATKLGELLSVEDNGILDEMDGVYGISIEEEIDPITIDIDDITLSLDPIPYSTEFSFSEVEIQDIHLDGIEKVIDLSTVTDFSLDDLNEKLPHLRAEHALHLVHDGEDKDKADEIEALLSMIKEHGIEKDVDLKEHKVSISKEIHCPLSFELPEQIEYVETILLTDKNSDAESEKGALMRFHLDHPEIFESLDMTLTFEAEFPEMFELSEPEEAHNYTLNGHTLRIEDMPVHDKDIVLQVYLDKITDIPHKDGKISCEDPIKYTLSYVFHGTMTLNTDTELEDLEIGIGVDTQLECRDAIGRTKPITFDFEVQEFAFPIKLEGIEYVNRINYVEFDASKSKICFETDMEHGFEPLELEAGSYIELLVPEQLVLDMNMSDIPSGVEYKPEAHSFHILDLEALHNKTWTLALARIEINEDITDGTLNIDDCKMVVRPSAEGVTFRGTTISLIEALEKLHSEMNFKMTPIDLHISDASITTDKIKADINERAQFSIDEPIDKGIKRIKRVGFEEPVALDLEMNLSGLENQDITADLNLDITLPPFLSITDKDYEGVEIDENNVLKISKKYQPGETLKLNLEVEALDFSTMEGGYLTPKTEADGNTYLQYSTDIELVGSAAVESSQLSLDKMDNDFKFDASLCIGDIKIKELIGLYSGEIAPITGSIPLDLGEDLDIFEGENTIKLSNPQFKIEFVNPVNIGLFLDLLISDNNGKELIKKDAVKINPARNENGQIIPNTTKLLITNKDVQLEGYQTILIPDISDLLADMPESIDYSLIPRIDDTEDQHIDLTQPFSFSGKYSVAVPFKFDELNFTYSDKISGINADLEEITEMFTINELTLSMNVQNTMPFELSLSSTALDENGHEIGIDLTEIKLPAGNGQEYSDDVEKKEVTLSMKGDMNEISRLDQIAFTVQLKGATETVGGIALRPEQGIHITQLAIVIGGDIEFDFKEMGNEEE